MSQHSANIAMLRALAQAFREAEANEVTAKAYDRAADILEAAEPKLRDDGELQFNPKGKAK